MDSETLNEVRAFIAAFDKWHESEEWDGPEFREMLDARAQLGGKLTPSCMWCELPQVHDLACAWHQCR